MNNEYIKQWLEAAGIRAVKTFAQSLLATITAASALGFAGIGWGEAFSIAGLAAVASILTSIVGIPEVKVPEAPEPAPFEVKEGDPAGPKASDKEDK